MVRLKKYAQKEIRMADASTSAPKARPAKVALKTRLVVLALGILSASFVMVLLGSLYKKPPTSYSIRK